MLSLSAAHRSTTEFASHARREVPFLLSFRAPRAPSVSRRALRACAFGRRALLSTISSLAAECSYTKLPAILAGSLFDSFIITPGSPRVSDSPVTRCSLRAYRHSPAAHAPPSRRPASTTITSASATFKATASMPNTPAEFRVRSLRHGGALWHFCLCRIMVTQAMRVSLGPPARRRAPSFADTSGDRISGHFRPLTLSSPAGGTLK